MNVGPNNFAKVMARIVQADDWTVDLETGSGSEALYPFRSGHMIGVAVRATGHSFYFPFRHVAGNLDDVHLVILVEELSRRQKIRGFNIGFDLKFLSKEGVTLPPSIEEVMVQAHLLNENEESFKLKALSDKYLGPGASQESKDLLFVLSEKGLGKGDMDKLPSWEVAPYACMDVELTDKLHDFYLPHLHDWKLHSLWLEMNEYCLALVEMELRGMLLDVPLVEKNAAESVLEAAKAKKVICDLAGYEINTNSSKQVQAWLGLESTAKDILEDLTSRPGVQELLDFRVWSKVKANYYDKFLWHMDRNKTLHANFNVIGTVTGRLSAADPPMQAIPRYTNKYRVKDVVVARLGMVRWEADYSQAEIRVATHYGAEENMRDKLSRGADIHTETAEEIQIPRDDAKRLNFSVIYGIGAKTYSERQGISRKEAKKMLDKYHAFYPGWRRLYNKAQATAEARGYIRMFTGRLRHYNVAHAPTHKASSNLVQGTVGEMLRLAILRVRKSVPDAKMDLCVHDSLNGELPIDGHMEQLREINREMVSVFPQCSVPPKVDMKVGDRWGNLRKVEFT